MCYFWASTSFTFNSDPVFWLKNLYIILDNPLWNPSYVGFSAISLALPFKTLCEIVLWAKSLLLSYTTLWTNQALFNSFL